MKNITNFFELIIIVLLAIIIVTPEILYSCLLRGRDWLENIISEL